MENRINQIIELADGQKFIVMKQAIYHDENYFAAARISDDEQEVYEDFHFFHEIEKDGQTYIETVVDVEIEKLLLKHLDQEEE